jgi:hypothetical protein
MGIDFSDCAAAASPERSALLDRWARDDAERRAAEARAIADARADARAVWLLADLMIPTDVKEFAARLRVPELGAEIWRSAFITGWRMAHRPVGEPDCAEPQGPPAIAPLSSAHHTGSAFETLERELLAKIAKAAG